MAFLTARLLYEAYWAAQRWLALARQGVLIEAWPLLADLWMGLAALWLVVTIFRRIKRLQLRPGLFISEAVLAGVLTLPALVAQIAFSAGWISLAASETIRSLVTLVIMPLLVLVFFDLLPK